MPQGRTSGSTSQLGRRQPASRPEERSAQPTTPAPPQITREPSGTFRAPEEEDSNSEEQPTPEPPTEPIVASTTTTTATPAALAVMTTPSNQDILNALADKEGRTVKPPKDYDGKGRAADFIFDTELYLDERKITDNKSKIRNLASYCTDTPKDWCRTQIKGFLTTGTWPTWEDFVKEFKAAFERQDTPADAIIKLENLRMDKKTKTVNDYNVKFNSIAGDAGFSNINTNPEAMRLYIKGLREDLIRHVLRLKPALTALKEFQDEALRVDNVEQSMQRLVEGLRNRGRDPNAMDVDAIDTRPQQRGQGRNDARRTGKCFNCQGFGHIARNCPTPRQNNQRLPGNQQRQSQPQWRNNNNTGTYNSPQRQVRATQPAPQIEEEPKDDGKELFTRVMTTNQDQMRDILAAYMIANPDFQA